MFGYKLFHLRKDGTIGPLFINRRQRIPFNKWLISRCIPTRGFTVRPGWHVCPKPFAPHLKDSPKKEKRVWCLVRMIGVKKEMRPKSQGGLWYLAKKIMVIDVVG